MNDWPRRRSSGMVLVFVLVTVLLMSLAATTLMKTALFHERLVTNRQLDDNTFLAAESVIAGSIDQIGRDARLRDQLVAGALLDTCLQTQGLLRDRCDQAAYVPTGSPSVAAPVALTATATTRYLGDAPVPGFSVDQVVYQQFSTEGRAYYDQATAIPFGHLNRQVWRRQTVATGVFQQ